MAGVITVERLREIGREMKARRGPFDGLEVQTSYYCPRFKTYREQFRKPRSKGKRIRKKWERRWNNWRTVQTTEPVVLQLRDCLYMHPETFEALKRQVNG